MVLVEPSGPSGPPAGAGAKAVSRKGARARRVPPPPPEPLWLPADAAPTAAAVAAAAQEAFAATYVMFRDAKVRAALSKGSVTPTHVSSAQMCSFGSSNVWVA